MGYGIYKNLICPEFHKEFTPQKHQEFVRDYFINSPYKGLLLFHRLGSGKTCSSIIIGDALLKSKIKNIEFVYVFTPGSLRQGWIEEYCGKCGDSEDNLYSKYIFITYNYNVSKGLPENFNNSLVIIDEVHNFINSVKNSSKTSTLIYAKLMSSNCKILALSGTPIFDKIYEFSLLGNLLKPNTFPPIIENGKFNKDKFMDLFEIDKITGDLKVKSQALFNENLKGIISYFPGASQEFYPTLIEEPILEIYMSPDQDKKFVKEYYNELEFLYPPDKKLQFRDPIKYKRQMQMYILKYKRLQSRQVSNFYYPKSAYDEKLKSDINWKGKKPDLLYPLGWINKKFFKNSQLKNIYSPKMAKLFENILNNFNSKHMVFTFFKELSGVNLMKSILQMCGLKSEVYSGDLSDSARRKLLKIYNSKENRYGDLIKILFVTDAGAEGINLLETGHVHIFESDVRENKLQQAIGRAVRYKSHYDMPKELQKVHIWRYWSINKDGLSIDKELYEKGQIKLNTFNQFLQILIHNSIEMNL
jgi:superfamily II DNA or RNA helicase